MTITLRQESQTGATTKGSSLTFAEMDNTVIDLLTNKIQAIQVDADSTNASVGLAQGTGVLEIKGGTNITTAIAADSAGTATLTITGTTFLANLTDDSSPQLSANLDMNGQKIVTTSNANLVLAPSGSGVVEIQGDGASADGTIQLNCSQNSHGIKLASPPHSAGQSYTLTFPSTAPASGKILQTDGSGNLSFVDMPSGGDSVQEGDNISITSPDSAGGKTIAFRNPLNQPVVGGDQTFSQINLKDYSETVYTSGTTTGTITPDVANGNVQSITLSGSITFSAFSNAAAGQSMTMIIRQPSSGGPYTLTSTMKFAGGTKTLSTTADAYDIMTVFYDGTNYFASLSTNFS